MKKENSYFLNKINNIINLKNIELTKIDSFLEIKVSSYKEINNTINFVLYSNELNNILELIHTIVYEFASNDIDIKNINTNIETHYIINNDYFLEIAKISLDIEN